MTEYGIELNVKDKNSNVYPKYFGYENIEKAITSLKMFEDKKRYNYPITNDLGDFYIEGDITLIIR